MRAPVIPLILLLFLATGCEKDLADLFPDSDRELTDGLCLVAGDQVVLNHHDIEHFDYGAQIIYLKEGVSSEELLEGESAFQVYAGGEEIYTIYVQPGYSSSLAGDGPGSAIIWTQPTFYPDFILAISRIPTFEVQVGELADSRQDQRIVNALKKYGQYYEGLSCEILSCTYTAPDNVVLRLKLTNRDEVNYYYMDPEKMGTGLFHYFTNGLTLWDTENRESYTNHTEHVQPEPWDSWDMEWMSLLEGGSSVMITLEYDNFDAVPPGSYKASFRFPGLGSQVERNQVAQQYGQVWLGELSLFKDIVVE
jgi:hypothetical protein